MKNYGYNWGMAHPKVLIADDDPDNLASISRYLNLEGFACGKVSSGFEAMGRLTDHPPACCLLDFGMDLDSLMICRRVRANPETKDLPMVLFVLTEADEGAALAAGASAVIYKPFHLATIAAVFRQLTGYEERPQF